MEPLEKVLPTIVPLIKKIAYGYLSNSADIEDLVQDVLIKYILMTRKKKTSIVVCPQSWINSISKTTAIDELRRIRRRRQYEDQGATARLNTLTDSEFPPFQIADKECDWDCRLDLLSAFVPLTEVQQMVLAFRAAGYTYSEIAQSQNWNAGTVRSRVHYAMSKAQSTLMVEGGSGNV